MTTIRRAAGRADGIEDFPKVVEANLSKCGGECRVAKVEPLKTKQRKGHARTEPGMPNENRLGQGNRIWNAARTHWRT
jgi:hypothetical protein